MPPWDPMSQVVRRLAAWRKADRFGAPALRQAVRNTSLAEIPSVVQAAIEQAKAFGTPTPGYMAQETPESSGKGYPQG